MGKIIFIGKSESELKKWFSGMLNFWGNFEGSCSVVDIIGRLENGKKSGNAIRKLVKGGAVQVNGTSVTLDNAGDIRGFRKGGSNFFIVRVGKRSYHTIVFAD